MDTGRFSSRCDAIRPRPARSIASDLGRDGEPAMSWPHLAVLIAMTVTVSIAEIAGAG